MSEKLRQSIFIVIAGFIIGFLAHNFVMVHNAVPKTLPLEVECFQSTKSDRNIAVVYLPEKESAEIVYGTCEKEVKNARYTVTKTTPSTFRKILFVATAFLLALSIVMAILAFLAYVVVIPAYGFFRWAFKNPENEKLLAIIVRAIKKFR